jgi:hypothetical protein
MTIARILSACFLLVLIATCPLRSNAQGKLGPGDVAPRDAHPAEPKAALVTKVYPVGDLVFSAPNYPYEGLRGSGGINGGGGFGGGGGGGGLFAIPAGVEGPEGPPARPVLRVAQFGGGGRGVGSTGVPQTDGTGSQFTIDQLTQAITTSIEPSSWSQVGGAGTIVALGGRLIVTQTAAVHSSIESLLSALRSQGGARSSITVRAWWLPLDEAGYRKLMSQGPPASPPLVDRKQLELLAAEPGVDFGEITCFDGQTVHIISGRFRNVVSSVIPVVGQVDRSGSTIERRTELVAVPGRASEPILADALRGLRTARAAAELCQAEILLAQAPAAGGGEQPAALAERSVGYQPVITTQQAGAMLELTPTRLPEGKIVLDVKCFVTQWDDQPQKQVDFRNVVALDQTRTVMQQLATTLKFPVRTPVLVGAMTLQPGTSPSDAAGKLRMHLVVEALDESKAIESPNLPRGR